MALMSTAEIRAYLTGLDGETVTVYVTGEDPASIIGIFIEPFAAETYVASKLETTAPKIVVASADVVGIQRNDKFTIRGSDYYVDEKQPDGDGLTGIFLKEQAT
jgi:hypothetical protein